MLQKGVAISMLLILCLLATGHQLLYWLQVAEAKAEMQQCIKSHRHDILHSGLLVKKVVDPAIAWHTNDEFSEAGMMYDIVAKRNEGGKLVVYCLADAKETALVNAYQKWNRQDKGEHLPSRSLIKLITTAYDAPGPWQFGTPYFQMAHEPGHLACNLIRPDRFVMTPPPWYQSV